MSFSGGQVMSASIRKATREDAHNLYQMIYDLACYEKEPDSVKVTIDDLARQLNQTNPPFECLIAEVDGKPVGFALYFYAYSTWEGSRTLYLEDLYVSPESRGAGAGMALMKYLADIANASGCKRFEWSVLDWNETAIDFYRKLGAKPVDGWSRYRLDGEAIKSLLGNEKRMVTVLP
jgi:GNAT superfamily N-acetyltransferase